MGMIYRRSEKLVCWSGSCGRQFKTAMLLLAHQNECNHFSMICCVCDYTFYDKVSARRHAKAVHFPDNHLCLQCTEERSFKRRDRLHQHQLKEHGEIRCDQCGEGFTQGRYLRQHVLHNHKLEKLNGQFFVKVEC